MTTMQTISPKQDKKSSKKRQQSFSMDIGTPRVPLRKAKKVQQAYESLSDWNHAS